MSALAQLLRASPGTPEAIRRAMADTDPRELLRECTRHGLSGLARHQLDCAGIELPSDLAAGLKRHALSIAATGLKVKALLFHALDALRERGITPVLLKGYGLATRMYPDPLLRPMSDVDLLVSPRELAAARAALLAMGLDNRGDEFERFSRAHAHHISFFGLGGLVELHFSAIKDLGSSIEADALLDRAVTDTLDGREVRYLRPADEVTYLSTHATHHLLQGAAWLYDIKLLLLRHHDLDWASVVSLAEVSEMESAVYFALKAVHDLLGAAVPAAVLDALRPPRWQAALGDLLFSGERVVSSPFAESRFSWAVTPLLASNLPNTARAGLSLAWRAPLRKFARHFPNLAPRHWRS